MKDPAYFREHAERCYRLAKGPLKPETAQKMTELGDEYMAKADEAETAHWPGSDVTKRLMDLAVMLRAEPPGRERHNAD